MARVEIEQQISFFSFGFARVSEVRHMQFVGKGEGREHGTGVGRVGAKNCMSTAKSFISATKNCLYPPENCKSAKLYLNSKWDRNY